jgi:hypothetical protein
VFSSGPIGQEPPCGKPRPMGIMRKQREVAMIPEGSRSQPGMLMGVGPGLCGVWTSESTYCRHLGA